MNLDVFFKTTYTSLTTTGNGGRADHIRGNFLVQFVTGSYHNAGEYGNFFRYNLRQGHEFSTSRVCHFLASVTWEKIDRRQLVDMGRGAKNRDIWSFFCTACDFDFDFSPP